MAALMATAWLCVRSRQRLACGVRRRYDAEDGNSNGFVGEVRCMIAVMMATAMSASMVTAMLMCCVNGDVNNDVAGAGDEVH